MDPWIKPDYIIRSRKWKKENQHPRRAAKPEKNG
jgi:hypothetical protein